MESAVERLTKHLQTTWQKYVQPEDDNNSRIILYLFGDLWVAFERSAYFLYQSCPGASPMVGRVKGNPFPLIICVVPKDSLDVLPDKATYIESAFRQRIYRTTQSLTAYAKWHRSKIKDYQDSQTPLWYIELRSSALIKHLTPATKTTANKAKTLNQGTTSNKTTASF